MVKVKVKYLNNFTDRFIGLSGLTKIYPVYFETRFGIHTIGMKKPIDVYILDSNNRIIKIKRNIRPNKFLFWNPKYSKVIETPVNFLKIKLGKKLYFEK